MSYISLPSKRAPGATDDNAAFAAAVAEACATGLPIYLPAGQGSVAGEYRIGAEAFVNGVPSQGNIACSNLRIFGDGINATIVRQMEGFSYLFFAHSGSADVSQNLRNIKLEKMTLRGNSDVPNVAGQPRGPSQTLHLLALSGTSDFLAEEVEFRAPEGDGVFLGSPFAQELTHNERPVIRACRFDGVTKRNRNGISVVDAVNWRVEGCAFVRFTDPGEPGAIDVEPERREDRVSHGTVVDCAFEDLGGYALWLALRDQEFWVEPIIDIVFKTSNINGARGAFAFNGYPGDVPANAAPFNINVESLYGQNMIAPFKISGARGVRLYANSFHESDISFLGEDAPNRDVAIENTTFVHCGKTGGPIIKQTGTQRNVTVRYSYALNCGRAGVTSPLYYAARGDIDGLVIIDNRIECTESPPKTNGVAFHEEPYGGAIISATVANNVKINCAPGLENLVTTP